MTTNVPSITFGPNGITVPTQAQILVGEEADINAAFGANLNFTTTSGGVTNPTPQGQLATSLAAIIGNVDAAMLYLAQQYDPAYASGRFQDAIGRYYFLTRDPAEPTTLVIACDGLDGVNIPVGATIRDQSNNIYTCTSAATITGGTITTTFACNVPGPVAVPAANGVQIYQSISGWDSATVVSGTQGVNTEGRQAFEARRQDSVAGNSLGAIGSIIGAVAQVPGVTDYFGYSNNTAAPVTVSGVTIAANAIFICVAGGAQVAIAQAILSKKGPGAPMTGNTTVTAYDSNPLYSSPIAYTIKYQTAAALQLLFSVTLLNSSQIPSNANVLVQQALINAVTQGILPNNSPTQPVTPSLRARIASVVYAQQYTQAINQLGSWAQVTAITIGSANAPGAIVVGNITGSTLTINSVTSGTVAVGQTLSDTLGLLLASTAVLSGSGSSWTVTNSQTLGATFTGTGSGTNLTASAVTGTISIGQTILGSGVPGSTVIVSQTSGTTGGAGVYVTNNATTSSGASLTANEVLTLASANQTNVIVRADQEPQLIAGNITVAAA